jgi:hypothetical protein
MAHGHGNTPAAWTGSILGMLGFVVGGWGLMTNPVNLTLFWVGLIIAIAALPAFLLLDRLGFNED